MARWVGLCAQQAPHRGAQSRLFRYSLWATRFRCRWRPMGLRPSPTPRQPMPTAHSSTGTSFAVVWMTRANLNAEWLGPWVVEVDANKPWQVGVAIGGTSPNTSVSVSWLRGPSSKNYNAPLALAMARAQYPGYPLPTATVIPLNIDAETASEIGDGYFATEMNPQGAAAVLWGSGGNQGNSTPLYATTSTPSTPWTPVANLSGTRGCSGGFPDSACRRTTPASMPRGCALTRRPTAPRSPTASGSRSSDE